MATPNTNVSVVDYLNSTGGASDFNSRAGLAAKQGIANYTGTAQQNTQLLGMLKGGSSQNTQTPQNNPTTTADATKIINNNQQNDFNRASGNNEPTTRGIPSGLDAFNQVSTALKSNLPNKPETLNTTNKFTQLRSDYGVTDLENSLTDLQAQSRDLQAVSKARTSAEKAKPVAMNVIAGRVSEEEAQDNERLVAINNSIQTVTSQLNSKYNVIDNIMKFMQVDYSNAVDSYDKQFSQNVSVYNIAKGISDDLKTEQEKVSDNARANAQIIINTMNSNGTTYGELQVDQQANLTKLGVQSGLGASFFQDVMNVSAGKDILTTITNDDKTRSTIIYKDGTTKVISTGLPAGSGIQPKTGGTGSGGTYTSGGLSMPKSKFGEYSTALSNQKGADGFVPPEVYLSEYKDWISKNGLEKDFVSNFPPARFVNPEAKELPLYLQNTSGNKTGTSSTNDRSTWRP